MDSLRTSTASLPLMEGSYDGVGDSECYVEWVEEDEVQNKASARRGIVKGFSVVAVLAVMLGLAMAVMTHRQREAQVPAKVGADDFNGEVVKGYTCGSRLVHACSSSGGFCQKYDSVACEAARLIGGNCEVWPRPL